MKTLRFPLIFVLLILGSLVLSACSGSALVRTWPGLSASKDTIYLADAGAVYSINASNGTMNWRFPDKPDNSKPFYAPPAVTDNLIVAGNYGHMLYGLTTDGKQKWVFDSKNGNFVGAPLVYKDSVFAPTSDNSMFAVSAVDGKELWSYKTENTLWATPATDGNVVYLPALDHNLYALNFSDGKLIWKKNLGSALQGSPILTQDGTLYLTTLNGEVMAVKGADGSVDWKVSTGGRLWSTPVLHEDTLYVGNEAGKVTAVSIKDKKIAWQQDAKSPILSGGALLPDGVAFTTEGGTVVAYPFTGEKELWRQTVSGKLYTTPVVAGQTLAVGIMEGANADANKLIQAYDVNGKVSWPFVAPK